PLLLVPPDVLLAFRPGLAVRVGGRAVVEDPGIGRPGPTPLPGHPALLAAGLPAGALVDVVLVDPRVDPRSAGRRSVGLQLLVAGDEVPLGVEPVDLAQYDLGVRLPMRIEQRVVPGQVERGPVALVLGARQPLPDLAAQPVEEVQLGA